MLGCRDISLGRLRWPSRYIPHVNGGRYRRDFYRVAKTLPDKNRFLMFVSRLVSVEWFHSVWLAGRVLPRAAYCLLALRFGWGVEVYWGEHRNDWWKHFFAPAEFENA